MKEKEFTLRSMVFGVLLGTLFLALIMYLDAVAGLDMDISPVVTMLGIMLMPLCGKAINMKEVNIMQTCASAVAWSGAALTGNYVALLLMGEKFRFWGALIPMLLGNLIGVCAVTLFRNQYVYDEKLPFPKAVVEMTALKKIENHGGVESRLLYLGIIVSVVISLLQNLGKIPSSIDFTQYLPSGITLGILIMPMMLGMGYVLGSKGGIILCITTLFVNVIEGICGTRWGWFPEPAVDFSGLQNFNLPVVIGVVMMSALLPLIKQWKSVIGVFRFSNTEKVERKSDIKMSRILLLLAVTSTAFIAFCSLYYHIKVIHMIIILLINLVFAMIGVRVQAESGLSAMMVLNICEVFIAYFLTKNPIVSLIVPFSCFGIIILAQNTMGDLKTGQIVGSSPRKQIWAQCVGVCFGCVIAVVLFYGLLKVYGLNSKLFAYPVAHMYQSLAAGVSDGGAAVFNLGRFGIGAGIGTILSFIGLPAGLIALALYLAPTSILAIALGGIIRFFVERIKGRQTAVIFVNTATGVIIGDGLVCIIMLFIMMLS